MGACLINCSEEVHLRSYTPGILLNDLEYPVTICEAALATAALKPSFCNAQFGSYQHSFREKTPINEALRIWISTEAEIARHLKCFLSNKWHQIFENRTETGSHFGFFVHFPAHQVDDSIQDEAVEEYLQNHSLTQQVEECGMRLAQKDRMCITACLHIVPCS